MGYFNQCLYHSANKEHAKYGTVGSTSSEKGTDKKKNNTSQYNHEYYMRNKEKWADNKDSDAAKEQEKEFDIDAAARDVIQGKYGNGEDRKKALGEDYSMVQKRVNELMKQKGASTKVSSEESAPEAKKDNELRTYEQAREDYNKKKKNLSHSDDLGSVLVRDLY